MQALDAALIDHELAFDHGMIGGRTVGETAVQFDMFGARQRHRHLADAVEAGSLNSTETRSGVNGSPATLA